MLTGFEQHRAFLVCVNILTVTENGAQYGDALLRFFKVRPYYITERISPGSAGTKLCVVRIGWSQVSNDHSFFSGLP